MPSPERPPSPDLRERRAELSADTSRHGTEWCRAYAAQADEWLRGVVSQACGGDEHQLALLAVGGYGRGELAPGSDLDLLLVHHRRGNISTVAEAIWYPIWDQGVHLDHSVRTPREVRSAMEGDLRVALGLLEARCVAGDQALAEEVAARALALWRTRSSRWLPEVGAGVRARHASNGDVAFLLEPDLKEGRGGFRDLHLLRAIAAISPVAVGPASDPALVGAAETLTAARVELQRPTATEANRLLLQEQDRVARALDLADADVLMAQVADAGRAVAWASDDGWRRIASALVGPRGRGGSADRPLGPGVVLRDGEVALTAAADPATDPALALRVAAASAEADRPIARASLDRLAANPPPAGEPWTEEMRTAFLQLLSAGHAAIGAIEALDQQGIWVQLLPEWSAVRNRPQRNAYHRFTVDRHLIETAANAAGSLRTVGRPDLLLLGALFHDIGKGRGGDHTEIGIDLLAELGPRIGLPPEDVATLQAMVRHHLLLPDIATRRDLDDPRTISAVAEAVGDTETLRLLGALTEADSLATGPSAWGDWKAGLVAELVERVARYLGGEPHVPPTLAPSDEERTLLAAGQLAVIGGLAQRPGDGAHCTVVAPDQPGLLAAVAGALALNGASVRSAMTRSGAGRRTPAQAPDLRPVEADGRRAPEMALLEFVVTPTFDHLPSWDRVRDDVAAALEGRLPLAQRLQERERQYRRRATSAYHPVATVRVDQAASDGSTVVEVRAPDRGPVLYEIAQALTDHGVIITSALVSTLGAEVIDVFYVRTQAGTKVPEDGQPGLEAALEAALTPET